MKKISYVLVLVLALTAMLISACGGSAAVSAPDTSAFGGGSKPLAMPVEFTGVIESINGNQWSVNGQTITVDPAVVHGPFNVGDTVKVEVQVQADGSMVVSSVETPAPIVAVVPSSSPDALGTPDDSPDAVGTLEPVSSSTPEPASSSASLNSNEAFGTVTSVNGNTVVIGGQTYQLANTAEIKTQLQSGASVKVHFILNADGTMTITEIENFDPTQVSDGSSNSGSNSVSHDLNDDGPNHDLNDDSSSLKDNSSSHDRNDDGPNHDQNDDSSSHDQSDDGPSHDQNDDSSGNGS